MIEHTYEIREQSDGSQLIYQLRADGRERVIDPNQQSYLGWLASGSTAPVIPYTAPEPPDLDSYKQQKENQITQAAKNQIEQIIVYRDSELPESFTEDLQATFTALYSYLIDKKVNEGLTEAEQSKIDYLNGIFQLVSAIQTHEIELKKALRAAQTHTAVDEIVWQYDDGFSGTSEA